MLAGVGRVEHQLNRRPDRTDRRSTIIRIPNMKTIPLPIPSGVREVQVLVLRDAPPVSTPTDTPERVANLMRSHWEAWPGFNPDVESCWVLFLNTRRVVTGIHKLADGTLDTLLVHPREIFRAAIVMAAAAIVLVHNHPSGDTTPSEMDVKITRDVMRAGQLLKIELLDHVVVIPAQTKPAGPGNYSSLRELGYLYN